MSISLVKSPRLSLRKPIHPAEVARAQAWERAQRLAAGKRV